MILNIEKKWNNVFHSAEEIKNMVDECCGDTYLIAIITDYGETMELWIQSRGKGKHVITLEGLVTIMNYLGCNLWNIRFEV